MGEGKERHSKTKEEKRRVSITSKELLVIWERQKGLCYYTGWPMTHHHLRIVNSTHDSRNATNVSLDRLANEKGYTLNNTVLCCAFANRAKSWTTHAQFVQMCKDVAAKWAHLSESSPPF